MDLSIAIIILLGLGADYLFKKIKLPGLIGMLIIGILAGPYVLNLMSPEMMNVSGDFRKIALIVILLRAGFELRRDTLNRVGRTAMLLSAVPALFEIAAVTYFGPKLLGISYIEAAILGAILGAVSPAVVVPLMIDFMDRGRGAKKGIPTLILAASSVDDVFVIVLFSIFLGMYGGGQVNVWAKLAEIPVSITLGILIGLIPGYILYRLFERYDWRPPKRTLIVLGISIMLTWIEKQAEGHVPIASLLGVMAIGFIILEKSEPIAHIMSQKLKKLWVFAELLLFVLVGAQVNIHVAMDAGLMGSLLIIIGLFFRSIGTYLCLIGTPLNQMERLFTVVSYIPKATVQAAIGAVPLAYGVASGDLILAIAVMSILLTAPIGAIGIMFLGERVLDHGAKSPYKFKELRQRLELPRVGERVRCREDGSLWKVIEERELWLENNNGHADTAHPTPAIELRLWREGQRSEPGKGQTIYKIYKPDDAPFTKEWEIIYDW